MSTFMDEINIVEIEEELVNNDQLEHPEDWENLTMEESIDRWTSFRKKAEEIYKKMEVSEYID